MFILCHNRIFSGIYYLYIGRKYYITRMAADERSGAEAFLG